MLNLEETAENRHGFVKRSLAGQLTFFSSIYCKFVSGTNVASDLAGRSYRLVTPQTANRACNWIPLGLCYMHLLSQEVEGDPSFPKGFLVSCPTRGIACEMVVVGVFRSFIRFKYKI